MGRSYAPHNFLIQSDSKNANKLSLALNRWNRVPIGVTFASALSFMARSACTYTFVVSMLSCPSHNAMTAMSTPDWSNAIAVPCRMTCGDTLFFLRVAHREHASTRALRSNRWMAKRVSDSPRMLGNAIACSDGSNSRNQSLRTRAVLGQSGIERSFRPFPCN